ncbi:uncharacterized protein LOC134851585 [Symsagittifera roscoffensis]|uniref:uncharacterized protein LOC134851585 n=1 Tax=Symsagittifera roscoffensis TaxID=84072 RepID=UPI00307BB981
MEINRLSALVFCVAVIALGLVDAADPVWWKTVTRNPATCKKKLGFLYLDEFKDVNLEISKTCAIVDKFWNGDKKDEEIEWCRRLYATQHISYQIQGPKFPAGTELETLKKNVGLQVMVEINCFANNGNWHHGEGNSSFIHFLCKKELLDPELVKNDTLVDLTEQAGAVTDTYYFYKNENEVQEASSKFFEYWVVDSSFGVKHAAGMGLILTTLVSRMFLSE